MRWKMKDKERSTSKTRNDRRQTRKRGESLNGTETMKSEMNEVYVFLCLSLTDVARYLITMYNKNA